MGSLSRPRGRKELIRKIRFRKDKSNILSKTRLRIKITVYLQSHVTFTSLNSFSTATCSQGSTTPRFSLTFAKDFYIWHTAFCLNTYCNHDTVEIQPQTGTTRPQFDCELRIQDLDGFPHSIPVSSPSQKHAGMWIGNVKSALA